MKICFLGSARSIHAYRWVRFFADRGHETHWLSMSPSIFDDMGGVRFKVIGGSSLLPVSFLRGVIEARRWVAEHRPDIVHAHYLGAYGLIGALCGAQLFVATAWGSDVLIAGKSLLKRPFLDYILRRADLITSDAFHMMEAIKKRGVPEHKLYVIYFGTDTTRFCPGPESRELRKRLDLGDAPAIVSLRSLEPIYDIESLLRAVPLVALSVPEAKFVIVGSGSLAGALKELAVSLGVSDSVMFVGHVANHELPMYLRTMDIYVSTALSDAGLASSTQEAMACGMPVVVTDCAENHRWVQSGVSGVLTGSKDPESLAAHLIALLKDRELRAELGRAGRKIIVENLDYASEMTKMERLYERLLTVHVSEVSSTGQ